MIQFLKNLFKKKEKEVDPFGDKFREQAKKALTMKPSDISEPVREMMAKCMNLDPKEFANSLDFTDTNLDSIAISGASREAMHLIYKILREDTQARLQKQEEYIEATAEEAEAWISGLLKDPSWHKRIPTIHL